MATASTAKRGTEEFFERQLTASADAVRGWWAGYQDELEVRDRLILEAVDSGLTLRKVAALAGISVGRVNAIVARRAAT